MVEAVDEDRDPLEMLAADFMERRRNGEYPSITEYVSKHPDLATEIREVFPAIAAMERLKVHCDQSSGTRTTLEGVRLERLGDFRILAEIGRGGMGIVYEAYQESLGRHVAVKVLPRQALLDSRQLQGFQREAKTAARLHHTNIVPLFGVGEQDGYHYIVMQLIRGVGLDAVLTKLRQMRRDDAPNDSVTSSSADLRLSFSQDAFPLARALIAGDFWNNNEFGVGPNSTEHLEAVEPSAGHASRPPDTNVASSEPVSHVELSADTAHHSKGLAAAITQANEVPTAATSASWSQGVRDTFLTAATFTKSPGLGMAYWRSVAAIGRQVADALQYAHVNRTLHRDIKPANLLLDSQGVVWITDFGLAKAMDEDQGGQTGTIAGTLRYMAPEQFAGGFDSRSDLYGLGLTLYELLTLYPAYADANRTNLIRKITQEEPVRPRIINPAIPADLETIVLKSIARDPAERYASAAALADDLERFLDDRPILARRTSALERLWRWARRNRAIAALGTLAALLLITTAVLASAGYVDRSRALQLESQLRNTAEVQRQRAEANLELAAQAFEDVFKRVAGLPLVTTLEDANEELDQTPMRPPVVGERDAEILRGLLAFYDQFAEKNQGNLAWQSESARAFRRAGEIQLRLSNYEEAERACRRALALYQRLALEKPGQPDFIAGMAATYNALGSCAWETGHRDRTFAESANACRVLLQHPEALADSPACRIELARAYNRYAVSSLLRRSKRLPDPTDPAQTMDPRDCLHRSIDIMEALLKETPGNVDYRLTRAQSYRHLWGLEQRQRRPNEAQAALDTSIRLLEELVGEFPNEPECRFTLVEAYLLPYRFPRSTPREEAIQETERAIEMASELTRRFPQVPKHHTLLAQALGVAARVQAENGDHAQSDDYLQRAIALQRTAIAQNPSETRYQFELVGLLDTRLRLLSHQIEPPALQSAASELIDLLENGAENVRKFPPFLMTRATAYAHLATALRAQGKSEEAQSASRKAGELMRQIPMPPRDRPNSRRTDSA